ncbi:MAG TPA: methyltransferase domain-containing protein [Dokdonella sp.]
MADTPNDTTPVDRDAVRWAYRLLLGREPESEEAVRGHAAGYATLAELRRGFIASEEFRRSVADFSCPVMNGLEPPLAIDRADDAALRDRLLDHVARSWSHLGETEPHWSVLTNEGFRNDRIAENLDTFYASGRQPVERLWAALRRTRLALPADAHCVELGCGVGRLTGWLAPQVGRVTALDVSPRHLEIAREHLAGRGVANVELGRLRRIEDLDALPPIQLFFTFLVLQHNPPPVIEAILDAAFARLAPGGIAYVHVPTYRPGYRFDLDEYLRTQVGEIAMEMHVLPQRDVVRLAEKHALEIHEVLEDAVHDLAPGMLTNYFLLRKRGA